MIIINAVQIMYLFTVQTHEISMKYESFSYSESKNLLKIDSRDVNTAK